MQAVQAAAIDDQEQAALTFTKQQAVLTSTKNRKRGLLRILYMRLMLEGQSNASCGSGPAQMEQIC